MSMKLCVDYLSDKDSLLIFDTCDKFRFILILNIWNSSNDILALYQIELAVRIKSQKLCNSMSKLNLLTVVYRRHNSLVRRLLSKSIYHNHDQYDIF